MKPPYPDGDDSDDAPLQLRDLPEADLPREKLMRKGRSTLTDEELIALFLRTGLKGCNVLELSAKMKRAAGSLAALGAMEAQDIAALCKGVGPAKAATLAAVFELGSRAVKETLSTQDMSHAQHIYDYLAPDLRYEQQENMVVLLLDVRNRLLRRILVGKGTLTRVVVHPRDIFRAAIQYNAKSIVLAHNHPSGDPTPSKADINLTRELVEASDILSIRIVDHVIIGVRSAAHRCPYFSFHEEGLL